MLHYASQHCCSNGLGCYPNATSNLSLPLQPLPSSAASLTAYRTSISPSPCLCPCAAVPPRGLAPVLISNQLTLPSSVPPCALTTPTVSQKYSRTLSRGILRGSMVDDTCVLLAVGAAADVDASPWPLRKNCPCRWATPLFRSEGNRGGARCSSVGWSRKTILVGEGNAAVTAARREA